jgi:hypothetical protein
VDLRSGTFANGFGKKDRVASKFQKKLNFDTEKNWLNKKFDGFLRKKYFGNSPVTFSRYKTVQSEK